MLSTQIVNQEALDSQVYNPTTQPAVLMLQQMMETTPAPALSATQVNPPPPLVDVNSVDADLKEHVQTFLSLPTTHPYHGVLVNPALCWIDDIRGDMPALTSVGQQLDQTSGQSDWANYQPTYNQDTSTITSQLDQIQDHTDRLTSNLPSLAGIAQGALALATVMNLLSNPCLGLDGLLGSIMDSGKQLLSQVTSQIKAAISTVTDKLNELKSQIQSGIQSAIDQVKSTIGPMINQVKDMMNVAKQAISSFISKAMGEIMGFAKALLAQIRQGLADLLANLPSDPCLKGLLQSAVTGAAAALI